MRAVTPIDKIAKLHHKIHHLYHQLILMLAEKPSINASNLDIKSQKLVHIPGIEKARYLVFI